jgi:predicted PurR-regulated permease PerM
LTKQKEIIRRADERDEETAAGLALTEEQTRVVLRLATRSLMWVVLLGLVVYYLIKATLWVFYALTGILLVIVLAIFFAYLIAPLVELVRKAFTSPGKGEQRLLPRSLAIAVVYVAIFGSLGVGAWVLVPRLGVQMAEITQQAPNYVTNARLGYVPWLVLVPILAFFFLKDADSFRRSALMMLPQGRIRWRGDEFFQDINSTLAAYIRAQLIACLIIGSVCTAAFAIFGVRYALVLGLVAGMLEFIPLLGPVVVAVLAATVAGFDSATIALAVLVFLAALRIVQDYVLYPRIIGSGIHLHPLAVILAILAGHELAGVAGIFLAIPVIAIMTVTYRHWLEHRGSAGLVAELLKPAETPAVETPAAAETRPPAPPAAATPTPPPADAPRAEPAR